jgi:hypothetical protein
MGIDNLWRTGDLHLEGVTARLPEACNGRRPALDSATKVIFVTETNSKRSGLR